MTLFIFGIESYDDMNNDTENSFEDDSETDEGSIKQLCTVTLVQQTSHTYELYNSLILLPMCT